MGKIKRGILGGFQGKVANVVGSSWKGIAVMKSLPISVAYPNTVKQQKVKTKFKAGAELSGKIKMVNIRSLWNRWAVMMSGFNAFMKSAYASINDFGAVDFSTLKLSVGSYLQPIVDDAKFIYDTSAQTLTFDTGAFTNGGDFSTTDKIYCMLCSSNSNGCYVVDADFENAYPGGVFDFSEIDFPVGSLTISILKEDGTQVSTSINFVPEIVA